MRRFEPDTLIKLDGVRYRVMRGHKASMRGEDLRLDWWTATGWRPVPSKAIALPVCFMYENEAHRYPREEGYEGGERFMRYLRDAIKLGLDRTDGALQIERQLLLDVDEEGWA